MKVTSGAYHESTIGLKKEVYSFARTRFNFVTVAASSSTSVADPVASVVDMKSCLVRCCCVEEDGVQNASVEAKSSSSGPRSVITAIFVMVKV